MSPLAPALTANSGPLLPAPPPAPIKSMSSPATGDAETEVRPPPPLPPPKPPSPPPPPPPLASLISQSTLPVAGSYDRMALLPQHTSSVRSLFFQTKGVDHDDLSLRETRQS